MMTSNFWQVLSRVGAGTCARQDWQHFLGNDWPGARQFFKPSPGHADSVIDLQCPSRRLDVVPDGEDGFLGIEADDIPDGPPTVLDAADVACLVVDWQSVSIALGAALRFEVLLMEAEGHTRQIGIRKKDNETMQPVVLCLPAGNFGDRARMVADLAARKDSTVLLPAAEWLDPAIHAIATANQLEIICLAEILQTSGSKPLFAKSARSKSPVKPLLSVQPDWHWQKLTIEVASGGRFIAIYGTERKEHSYKEVGPQSYTKDHEILMHLAAKKKWTNPHTSKSENEAVRKQFFRFRKQFEKLIGIPGEAFFQERNDWIPKFEVRLHKDLAEQVAAIRNPRRR